MSWRDHKTMMNRNIDFEIKSCKRELLDSFFRWAQVLPAFHPTAIRRLMQWMFLGNKNSWNLWRYLFFSLEGTPFKTCTPFYYFNFSSMWVRSDFNMNCRKRKVSQKLNCTYVQFVAIFNICFQLFLAF